MLSLQTEQMRKQFQEEQKENKKLWEKAELVQIYDSVYEARPIIKTKATTGPRGAQGNGTQKTTLDDPIERADLQGCHGRKPGETETETED